MPWHGSSKNLQTPGKRVDFREVCELCTFEEVREKVFDGFRRGGRSGCSCVGGCVGVGVWVCGFVGVWRVSQQSFHSCDVTVSTWSQVSSTSWSPPTSRPSLIFHIRGDPRSESTMSTNGGILRCPAQHIKQSPQNELHPRKELAVCATLVMKKCPKRSRGLDFPDVSLVVQFNLPEDTAK